MQDDECNALFLCNRQGKIRRYIYIRLQLQMEMFPSQAKSGQICDQPSVEDWGFLHSDFSSVSQSCCVQGLPTPQATPHGLCATWQHEEPMRTSSYTPAVGPLSLSNCHVPFSGICEKVAALLVSLWVR